jgi:hypothetical protein
MLTDLIDATARESEDSRQFSRTSSGREGTADCVVTLGDERVELCAGRFDVMGDLLKFHKKKCTARLTPMRIARYTLNMTNNNSPKAGQTYKLINGRSVTVTKVTAAKVRYTWINEAGETIPFISARAAFANPVMATLVN